jgi:hypothetical protein
MNLHVYVDDVDNLYQRAIAAGGVAVREPEPLSTATAAPE